MVAINDRYEGFVRRGWYARAPTAVSIAIEQRHVSGEV
jgi:hypothetical protein